VRTWIPWSLLVGLVALAAVGGVVGAAAEPGGQTHRPVVSPSYTPVGSLTTIPARLPEPLPLQGGYRGIETFCAVAPLTGTIRYDGTSGGLSGVLTVSLGGLPPQDQILVNWSNDFVRAPVIGVLQTDSGGNAIPSSVAVYRLGEVRGVEIVLSGASVASPTVGRLDPC
jgi:hypothetical protein